MTLSSLLLALQSVCLLLLFWRMFLNDERYTAFKFYVASAALSSLLAFVVSRTWPGMPYFVIYYLLWIVTGAAGLVATWEIYMFVFGPRIALPRWVPERTLAMVAVAFTGALAIAAVTYQWALRHPVAGKGPLTRAGNTAEVALVVARWAILVLLAIYSRSLKITGYPQRIAQIWFGFVLFLSSNMVSIFVRSMGGMRHVIAAGLISQFAFVLSTGWWLWCLWEKELERRAAGDEEIHAMLAMHKETMEFLRGVVGVEEVKG